MVIISERYVQRLIEDVAPKVERLTGWDTHLDDLTVRIVRRDQVWDQGIKPKYDILGIDVEPTTEEGKKALGWLKFVMPYLMLAQYDPMTNTLMIIPDNVRFGTNESGLAIILRRKAQSPDAALKILKSLKRSPHYPDFQKLANAGIFLKTLKF